MSRQRHLIFTAITMAIALGAIIDFAAIGFTAIRFPKKLAGLSNNEFQNLLLVLGTIFLVAAAAFAYSLKRSEGE